MNFKARNPQPSLAWQKNQGFSLVEIAATTVILSIGLLGLASLHFEALKKTNESFYKSMASIHASDLIDRMRANIDAANSGLYETVSGNGQGQGQGQGQNKDCSPSGYNAAGGNGSGQGGFSEFSCSEAQIANYDLTEWQENIGNVLPSGESAVCRTSAPGQLGQPLNCNGQGSVYVISITWRDPSGDGHEYRVSFKP